MIHTPADYTDLYLRFNAFKESQKLLRNYKIDLISYYPFLTLDVLSTCSSESAVIISSLYKDSSLNRLSLFRMPQRESAIIKADFFICFGSVKKSHT